MCKRSIRFLVALALVAYIGTAQAYSYLAQQIQKQFSSELYPIESLLPGYQRPRWNAPKLVVAEFRVADDDLKVWSQAVAEILTYRIQYVPGALLYMPAPYNNHVDAGADVDEDRPLLTDAGAFGNLHRSLGIDTVLTGVVKSRGDKFALIVELVDAGSGKTSRKRAWTFTEDGLPKVLIEITRWVYQSLDVKLKPRELAYIEDMKTLGSDAIQAFIDNYTGISKLDAPLRADKVRQLHEAYPELALLSVYALHTRPYAKDLDEAYRNLDFYRDIRSRSGGNAGIELESYRVMQIEGLPKHEVSKRLENMKKLVAANPQDPTIMIVFADALIKNGQTFEGISVLLEAVERWPENYRVWWSLGWALNKHAWQVRGDSIWRDVPERAKQQYTLLSDYSDQAVDEALELNPHAPMLWSMKINSIGSKDGFTDELMATFDKAVEVAPNNRYIYENALNYSTGRWGGNAAARKHIIAAAEKHNPDSAWIEPMRRRHVVDLDNWQDRLGTSPVEVFIKEILDHPSGRFIGAIVIIVVLVMVFQMGRRSA